MYTGVPFVNTDSGGTAQSDMTNWQLCMEFFPIEASLIKNVIIQNN
jgi:hypothetical protein